MSRKKEEFVYFSEQSSHRDISSRTARPASPSIAANRLGREREGSAPLLPMGVSSVPGFSKGKDLLAAASHPGPRSKRQRREEKVQRQLWVR
jgi:lipid-binding SYLF domain-containing protein